MVRREEAGSAFAGLEVRGTFAHQVLACCAVKFAGLKHVARWPCGMGRWGQDAYVFHVAERVVDGDDVSTVLLARRTAHEAADATETGDTHIDHGC